MTANRVALYSRVSTHHGQDPELQLRELREYTASRGLTMVQEYADVGFSGSKDSRPALNQLIADARRCRFDSVLVWKIDRWGRSLKQPRDITRGIGRLRRGLREPAGQS